MGELLHKGPATNSNGRRGGRASRAMEPDCIKLRSAQTGSGTVKCKLHPGPIPLPGAARQIAGVWSLFPAVSGWSELQRAVTGMEPHRPRHQQSSTKGPEARLALPRRPSPLFLMHKCVWNLGPTCSLLFRMADSPGAPKHRRCFAERKVQLPDIRSAQSSSKAYKEFAKPTPFFGPSVLRVT
jgi:hypothetical protein